MLKHMAPFQNFVLEGSAPAGREGVSSAKPKGILDSFGIKEGEPP